MLYIPKAEKVAEVEAIFTYHTPRDDQPARYVLLRDTAKSLAMDILRNTPASREQALALTHLETAIMYANAAIARREP
jgi:hypothetical protein